MVLAYADAMSANIIVGLLPGSGGQHFGVGAKVAEADWSIIPNLTAEVVQVLEKKSLLRCLNIYN